MYNFWLISGIVTFILFIISWVVFYQISVRYMESEILKEGRTPPPRRLIGAIAIHYATVLIFCTDLNYNGRITESLISPVFISD